MSPQLFQLKHTIMHKQEMWFVDYEAHCAIEYIPSSASSTGLVGGGGVMVGWGEGGGG